MNSVGLYCGDRLLVEDLVVRHLDKKLCSIFTLFLAWSTMGSHCALAGDPWQGPINNRSIYVAPTFEELKLQQGKPSNKKTKPVAEQVELDQFEEIENDAEFQEFQQVGWQDGLHRETETPQPPNLVRQASPGSPSRTGSFTGAARHRSTVDGYRTVGADGSVLESKPRISEPQADRVYEGYEPVYEPMEDSYSLYGSGPLPCDAMPCFGEPGCGCDPCGVGCDGGCDGCAYASACQRDCGYDPWDLGQLLVNPRRFITADLLLTFRRGQRLPALVTTGPTGAVAATAGVLPAATILYGGDIYGHGLSTGLKVEAGHWLDPCRCQSLLFRAWGSGRQNIGFNADQNTPGLIGNVLARPFNDVTSGTSTPAAQRVFFTGESSSGSVAIAGSSEVYGGDLLLRHKIAHGLGGRIDWLMGYQLLRVNEDLSISTSTQSINPAATIAIQDVFDTKNEFHGATFGMQGHYREGCHSLEVLFKLGFGQMNREVDIRGNTTTSTAVGSASSAQGLLARGTNSGRFDSSTFSFAPEVQVGVGQQLTRALDFTIGYSFIGVTDVIQPSGAIDRQLQVNLSEPLTGAARPFSPNFGDRYWVHAIQFGLDWNW